MKQCRLPADWVGGGRVSGLADVGHVPRHTGQYARAFKAARDALANAERMGQLQWRTGAHTALGMLYLDVLAFEQARKHLEEAWALAGRGGSQIWTRYATGYLALVLSHKVNSIEPSPFLTGTLLTDASLQMQGQRLCGWARAELAMAQGDQRPRCALWIDSSKRGRSRSS